MANSKRTLFLKRRMRVRNKLRGVTANQGRARLSVHRSNKNISALLIDQLVAGEHIAHKRAERSEEPQAARRLPSGHGGT